MPGRPYSRRKGWRRERQWRLPRRRRRRGSGRRPRPLVYPALQQRDLLVAQRQLVERHPLAQLSLDPPDHHAARRVARPHHRAVLPAVEHVAIGRQRQSTLALVLAVALEAVFRQDRLDLPFVVDSRRAARGRRALSRRRGWPPRRRGRRRRRGSRAWRLPLTRRADAADDRNREHDCDAADSGGNRAAVHHPAHDRTPWLSSPRRVLHWLSKYSEVWALQGPADYRPEFHMMLGAWQLVAEQPEAAVASLEHACALGGRPAWLLGWLGLAYGAAGRHEAARVLLEDLQAQSAVRYVPPFALAMISLGLNDLDAMFESMN